MVARPCSAVNSSYDRKASGTGFNTQYDTVAEDDHEIFLMAIPLSSFHRFKRGVVSYWQKYEHLVLVNHF